MKLARVENLSTDLVLGDRIAVADRWWLRLRGLLGAPAPSAGEGLLLIPCRAVHMRAMQYPLDIVFCAANGVVLAEYHSLPPGARTGIHWRARFAVEVPAGTLRSTGTQAGDILHVSLAAAGSPSLAPRYEATLVTSR